MLTFEFFDMYPDTFEPKWFLGKYKIGKKKINKDESLKLSFIQHYHLFLQQPRLK